MTINEPLTVTCDSGAFLDPCGTTLVLEGEWFHDLEERGLLPDSAFDVSTYHRAGGAVEIEIRRHGWISREEPGDPAAVRYHQCARCTALEAEEADEADEAAAAEASKPVKVGDVVILKGRSIPRRVTGVGESLFLAVDHTDSLGRPVSHPVEQAFYLREIVT